MARAIDGRSDIAKAIKGDIYQALREGLVKPEGKSKRSWANNFIELMLKEAKHNVNGAIGQIIAKQLLTEDIITKLDAETDKYLARDKDFVSFRIMNTLYKEQRDVFLDKYRRKIAICSRRVGKTELAARILLDDMKQPNRHAIFIAMKFENAMRQCYNIVLELAETLGMPIERTSKADGEILFANGSNILFKGNSNKAEADKLLGYKFSVVVIDECQTQTNLLYLIDTVLRPALIDYEDSQILLLGTPPRIPKTAVETIWHEYKDWHHYSWDMTKNPYIPNVKEYIHGICADKNCDITAPFIQREMLGQWAYDVEAQVFKDAQCYDKTDAIALCNDLNLHIDKIYIGNDYGWNDYNAVIGIAVDSQKKKGFVYYEQKWNKSTVTEIVNQNQIAIDEGRKILIHFNEPISNIAIYGDTSDKSIIYEMSQTYNMPAYCCYKYDKANAIAMLSDYCREGKILIQKDGVLYDEMQRTLYKRLEDDSITSEIDDDLFHPDALFALLYASRQIHFDWTQGNENEV